MSSKDIISLVGEPDFHTPWNIRDEAIYRMQRRYNVHVQQGLTIIKDSNKYLNAQFSINYSSEELLITNVFLKGLILFFVHLLIQGMRYYCQSHQWCYRPLIELCDGVVVEIDTSKSQFIPKVSDFEKKLSDKTKAIVLSYPNNPTGQSIPKDELERIADFAHANKLLVITDEIYAI